MASNPYISPSWAKRMTRMNTPKVPKRPNLNDPQQAAAEMFSQGLRAGADGTLQPTQDFGGLMSKASQGINSMSRGATGGQFSSLGKPLNSMYEQNPGFFNRGGNVGGAEGFSQMLAQRGQPTAQAAPSFTPKAPLPNDTPGAASAAARAGMMKPRSFSDTVSGAGNRPVENLLIERRGFGSPTATQTPTSAPAPQMPPSQMMLNRKGLEEAVSAKKLLAEAAGAPVVSEQGGVRSIAGKYGSGTATAVKGPRAEGIVNGRPFSEVMQGLANKPGVARAGDKFQPQNWSDVLKRKKAK